MMSGHGANPFFFNNKKNWTSREHSLTPTPALYIWYLIFTLHPLLPLTPSKWTSYVYHPYKYCRDGWWNFKFFAGIKWVGFPPKSMGKNHKDFLRNPKQVCMKLHRIKWKTFGLANWKQSELDVKMKKKWQELVNIYLLHNTGYDA